MTINVTQKHINRGHMCSSLQCPVALALTESLGKTIKVGPSYAVFPDVIGLCPLPLNVIQFITEFDMGRKVEPFSFEFAR